MESGTEKGLAAQRLIERATDEGVVALQVLLEFVAVIRKREPARLADAIQLADGWARTFQTVDTTDLVRRDAMELSQRHRLQIWDAVIIAACARAGADVLFSEDMQDRAVFAGVTIVNPFLLSTRELESYFEPRT